MGSHCQGPKRFSNAGITNPLVRAGPDGSDCVESLLCERSGLLQIASEVGEGAKVRECILMSTE
ncbi:Uncharacterised protein [Achromobacter sp. 2789STDY5608633]|nr:Uncharacterised protein [Achromobacter sp. 2789STDY5608633]